MSKPATRGRSVRRSSTLSKIESEIITPLALAGFKNFSPSDRKKALRALNWLRRSPEPDGYAKRELPAHKSGTYGAFYDDLMLVYTFQNYTLTILYIQKTVKL